MMVQNKSHTSWRKVSIHHISLQFHIKQWYNNMYPGERVPGIQELTDFLNKKLGKYKRQGWWGWKIQYDINLVKGSGQSLQSSLIDMVVIDLRMRAFLECIEFIRTFIKTTNTPFWDRSEGIVYKFPFKLGVFFSNPYVGLIFKNVI